MGLLRAGTRHACYSVGDGYRVRAHESRGMGICVRVGWSAGLCCKGIERGKDAWLLCLQGVRWLRCSVGVGYRVMAVVECG